MEFKHKYNVGDFVLVNDLGGHRAKFSGLVGEVVYIEPPGTGARIAPLYGVRFSGFTEGHNLGLYSIMGEDSHEGWYMGESELTPYVASSDVPFELFEELF